MGHVNGTGGGGNVLVPDMIAGVGLRRPEAAAIESAAGTVTYGDLLSRAGRFAAKLKGLMVGETELVAICLLRSSDQIAAMLGVWRLGAGYLPLDPAWPEVRLAALIADAQCAVVIAEPGLGARIAGQVPLVTPGSCAEATEIPGVASRADHLAYAIYTSGSTGAPKAVEVTQVNVAALTDWHCRAFGLREGARTSHIAGLGFDASAWEVWPTLAAGGTLVLADEATRLDPVRLRDWLLAQRIEVAFAPTALAEPLLALAWPEDAPLRILLTGADRLTKRPPARLPFQLVNNYGPTESTVVATSGVVASHEGGLPSIGKPIDGTDIHLLNSAGEPVGAGEEGEICISGAQVARGYRGDAALTAARFVIHPRLGRLYHTGDLGAWLANGELDFRGRLDAQVKIRGHRIEPAEVCAVLNQLPGVAASAVIAREDELIAYVVPVGEAPPIASALRAILAARLPDYMVPARFATLAALPLTANGKVDARALPDPGSVAMAEGSAIRPPATPTEARLLEIVTAVIGRDEISVDDDFFLAGGHSLLGTQVVIRARDAFGVELTLFHLFEGRTVASLATIVEGLVLAKLDSFSDEDVLRMAAR